MGALLVPYGPCGLKVGWIGHLFGSLWIPRVRLHLAAVLAEVFSDLGLAAFDEMGKVARGLHCCDEESHSKMANRC